MQSAAVRFESIVLWRIERGARNSMSLLRGCGGTDGSNPPISTDAGKGAGFGDQVLRVPLRQSVALCRRAACQSAISGRRRNLRRRSGGLPNLCRSQGPPRQCRSEASASLGRADWFAARRAEGYEARKLTEFARKGYRIRVNSMHPGTIDTDMGDQVLVTRARNIGTNDIEAARRQVIARLPIGRMGAVSDIAKGI